MRRSARILMIGLAVAPGAIAAQTEYRVESHGSNVVITAWPPQGRSVASVLLVPGWAGGPSDVLGIARALSGSGVETFVLTPRGWYESEGEASFSNALQDIGVALRWVREHSTHEVALGGHSFGGGMALVYSAQDPTVRRIISVAGTDHGILIRHYLSDPSFAADFKPILESTLAPEGPIRANADSIIRELTEGQAAYGLQEQASALTDRSILMFGGWEDVNVTVDESLLPFYRSLRAAGATDVTFRVYHTNHGFENVREAVQDEILAWLRR